MRRIILYILYVIIPITIYLEADCQYYFYNEDYYEAAVIGEAGFSMGAMNCLTDLGGKKGIGRTFIKDINWNNSRPGGSLFVGARYRDILGGRLEFSFGQVKASDQVLKNDRSAAFGRYLRNLSFRTNIKEWTFSLEFYLLSCIKSNKEKQLSLYPYVIAGIGTFRFSPEAFYKNTWINLSGLHTEGQGFAEYPDRKEYRLRQLNLPLGLGFKYEASPILNFHIEIIYRKLWTDYLDDVSNSYINPALFYNYLPRNKANLAAMMADRSISNPAYDSGPGDIRGNDKRNDAYFSGIIKIGFVIGRQKR